MALPVFTKELPLIITKQGAHHTSPKKKKMVVQRYRPRRNQGGPDHIRDRIEGKGESGGVKQRNGVP